MMNQTITFKPRPSYIAFDKEGNARLFKEYPHEGKKGGLVLSKEVLQELGISWSAEPIKCTLYRSIELTNNTEI